MEILANLLKGVAVGLANIIPGVSGGTMALILGIYQRLIRAIHNLGPQTVKAIFAGPKAWGEELRRIDALFLGTLAVGALVAIVATAELLKYLLMYQHDPTYGFFFGLVFASVVVPYKMIRQRSVGTLISCLCAIAVVVGLSLAMSGDSQLESAKKKAALKAKKLAVQQRDQDASPETVNQTVPPGSIPATDHAVDQTVPQDLPQMVIFFLAGAIAISAMILPGISGSFILLLMGVYFDVLACVTERQLLMLGIFSLGCGVGILFFTRLLNFLLEHYHDITISFLLGLVIGSLYAIWPFKSFGMAGGRRVDMDNIFPASFGANELLTLGAVVVGCGVVVVFLMIEKRQGRSAAA